MTLERSCMVWYVPANPATHARALARSGCTAAWLKAGVDNPGLTTAWAQWTNGTPDLYAANGVEPLAWFYVYPEAAQTQWDTIARALEARPSRIICLNAEVEWDDRDQLFVHSWVDGLRTILKQRGIVVDGIGFSSVPSWDKGHGGTGSRYHDFPYEAWCEASDFSMPQAYFTAPDEILWENPRNATDHPVIPTLWAVGDPGADPPGFTDDDLVAYAKKVIGECEHFAGFSSWRADLATYQYDGMRRCYAAMEEIVTEKKTDTGPAPDGLVRAYISADGHAHLDIDFGGESVAVDSYAVIDAGIGTHNTAGEHYHRTLRMADGFLPWVKE